jgi:hypothetical protein
MNLERFRCLCLVQPGATEQMQWDVDAVFTVGGKMFAGGIAAAVAQSSARVRAGLPKKVQASLVWPADHTAAGRPQVGCIQSAARGIRSNALARFATSASEPRPHRSVRAGPGIGIASE